ncbi:hypothetical protein L3X38_017609 [Prunus dulcis]|uniref:Uncharacterized protein n=1 Tax=Prunus dulcis TaxID=3755 RepID=A0AAD4W8G1_PRUDU|nr:hypothetical protein L3X38_017609 [Prunus dulcis]
MKSEKFERKLAASSPFFGEITTAGSGTWLGLEEDGGPVFLVLAPSALVAGREHGPDRYKEMGKGAGLKGASALHTLIPPSSLRVLP